MYDLAPYLAAGENVIAVSRQVLRPGNGVLDACHTQPHPRQKRRHGLRVRPGRLGLAGQRRDLEGAPCRGLGPRVTPTGARSSAGGVPMEIFDARRFPLTGSPRLSTTVRWGQGQVIHAMMSGLVPLAAADPSLRPALPALRSGSSAARWSAGSVSKSRALPSARDPARWLAHGPGRRGLSAAAGGAPQSSRCPPEWTCPMDGAVWIKIDMGRIVSGFVQFESAGRRRDRVRPLLHRRADPRWSAASAACGPGRATSLAARTIPSACSTPSASATPTCWCTPCRAASSSRNSRCKSTCIPGRSPRASNAPTRVSSEIFQAGVRTVQLCSPDAFVDCPTREQRAWTGDGVVHQMVTLAANRDWRLAKRYVELGNSPRADGILPMFTVSMLELTGSFTLPDWSLHWVHGVYNWYRYAGDRGAVLSWLPTVARILRWYVALSDLHRRAQGCGRVEPGRLVERFDHAIPVRCSPPNGRGACASSPRWPAGWVRPRSRHWAEDLYERAQCRLRGRSGTRRAAPTSTTSSTGCPSRR